MPVAPNIPQIAQEYNREVRADRLARALRKAWAWLAACFLILVASLCIISGVAQAARLHATPNMSAIAARGW